MSEVPSADDWLSPRERAWVERMRFEKRRSEFRLGRWTAKRALGLFLESPHGTSDLSAFEIDRAPDGAPAPTINGRPAAASISMTDRADQAVCVVGPARVGLGCDLELIEPRSEGFLGDYLTEAERSIVRQARTADEGNLRANLVWSAKESALKVLRTGLRRDTRSVEVRFPNEPPVDGWSPLAVRTVEGSEYPGWWRRYGEFLLSVAATESFSPPRALVEPPGLASAVPAHGWMKRRG
jgi:4'-phosphopantetheinyl transferase